MGANNLLNNHQTKKSNLFFLMGNKHKGQCPEEQPIKYAFTEDELQAINKNYTEISVIEQE